MNIIANLRQTILLCLALAASVVILSGITSAHSEPDADDPILRELSGFHLTSGVKELEALAGGEDGLVEKLLQYRHLSKPPAAGIRATRILIYYSHRTYSQFLHPEI